MNARRPLPLAFTALLAAFPATARAALPDCRAVRAAAPCAIQAGEWPGDRYDPAPFYRAAGQPRLALALSGGGGRGLAHIGVLKGLEALAIRPDALTGNSGGALIGALYAAGYSPGEIEAVFTRRDWNQLIGALDLRRGELSEAEETRLRAAQWSVRLRDGRRERKTALFSDHDLEAALTRHLFAAQLLSGGDFDALRMPLRVVASDLGRLAPFAPARGDLTRMVRASMAFPPLYDPVEYEGRTLVDGMLVSNIPTAQARELRADLVVASNVTQPFSPAASAASASALGGVRLLGRSIDLMLARQMGDSLALAGEVFTPDTRAFSSTEFSAQLPAAIEAGLAAVDAQDDALMERLERLSGSPSLPLREVRGAADNGPEAAAALVLLRARLGARPGALRVSRELARLRNGPWREAEAAYDPAAEILTVRLALHAAWRRTLLTLNGARSERPAGAVPFSWDAARETLGRLRGDAVAEGRAGFHFLAARFDEDEGTLRVAASDGLAGGLVLEGLSGPPAKIVAARSGVVAGRPLDMEAVVGRLAALGDRGVIDRWTLGAEPADGDAERVRVRLAARAVSGGELRAGGSYRDALGGEFFAAGAWRNPLGRGDRLELAGVGSRISDRLEVQYRVEYPFLAAPRVGLEANLLWFADRIPLAGAGQDYFAFRPWRGREARMELFRRDARLGRLAAGFSRGGYRSSAFEAFPADSWSRGAVTGAWDFDTRDRILVPTRGHAVRARGDASLSGRSWRRAEASLESCYPLHARLEGTLALKLAGGAISGDAPFPRELDPGGWREAWGFIPRQLAARRYTLATAAYRLRLADLGPVRLYGEAGAAAARLDPRAGPTRYGAGAALIVVNDWIGPVTVGYQTKDRRGGGFFFQIGLPLPRE